MKNVLIIENDAVIDNSILTQARKIADGGEIIELTNLKSRITQLKEILKTDQIQSVVFKTAYVGDSVSVASKVLSAIIKAKNNLEVFCNFCTDNSQVALKRALKDNCEYIPANFDPCLVEYPVDKYNFVCNLLDRHSFYELYSWRGKDKFDFSLEVGLFNIWLERRNSYINSRREAKIGVKIIVDNLESAPKKVKDFLDNGQEIDLVDCTEIDAAPNRGVWIMCGGTPYKLLKDSCYSEFNFLPAKSIDELIYQIIHSSDLGYKNMDNLKTTFVRGVLSIEGDNKDLAQDICDELGIERRYNRSHIEKLISNYKN